MEPLFSSEADVSKASEVEAMINTVVGSYGRLDYAHNNAGILGELAPTAECTEENWENVINTNLKGVWLCMKYEIPKMRGGAIVNTSSVFGLKGGSELASLHCEQTWRHRSNKSRRSRIRASGYSDQRSVSGCGSHSDAGMPNG